MIDELDMTSEELLLINEMLAEHHLAFSSTVQQNQKFEKAYQRLIIELKDQGYIGDDPLRHWAKNDIVCKLDIINPDIFIQDNPQKKVTPTEQDSFRNHVEQLLKLKVIRPNKSRLRTCAFIVKSETSTCPTIGKKIRGKERLIFNYKKLNDNTHKD
ncbi:hypothetical protein V6N13_103603 [Hibiscus sabdariffa]|uniref:Reverse transcriptase/retrotransposon-derived protein RNase H-like domain-containing protein n=1 Tax=Hibiscus sabdariffa TaxID=183260 RepID=A0ABR2B5T5_9ROSI